MRLVHGWKAALLCALLAGAEAPRVEAQRPPEQRAQREAARRGWIGITFDLARGAAVVRQVYPESPAARAGIEEGDTIVRWDGRTDVEAAFESRVLQPGDTLRLRVRREGREREVVAVAAERPPAVAFRAPGRGRDVVFLTPREIPHDLRLRIDSLRIHADSLHSNLRAMLRDSLAPHFRELERMRVPDVRFDVERLRGMPLAFDLELGMRAVAGAEFAEMNPGLSDYFGTDRGVLVLRVVPGTPAERAGLQAGDVVVSAEGEPVESVRDLRRAVGRAAGGDVELEVVRKGERREVRMREEV